MAVPYNHREVEKKWQNYWAENETFKTDVWDFSKPKYYALDMFPYPSGVGLHAGHPEGYNVAALNFQIGDTIAVSYEATDDVVRKVIGLLQ